MKYSYIAIAIILGVNVTACGSSSNDVVKTNEEEITDSDVVPTAQSFVVFDAERKMADAAVAVVAQAKFQDTSNFVNSADDEQLVNGLFESGLEGWTVCDGSSAEGIGTKVSVEGEAITVENSCAFQSLFVSGGDRLTLTCNARNANAHRDSWSGIGMAFSDSQWEVIDSQNGRFNVTGSGAFQTYTETFEAPNNALYASLWIGSEGQAIVSGCSLLLDPLIEPAGIPVTPIETVPDAANYLASDGWDECAPSNDALLIDGHSLSTGSGDTCVYQSVPVNSGETWSFSCDAKINASPYSELVFSSVDSEWEIVNTHVKSIVSTDYETYQATLTTTAQSTRLTVLLYAEGSTDYTNCALSKIDDTTSNAVVQTVPRNALDFPAQISDSDVRFLNQATFGATPQLLRQLKNMSHEEWIDMQLATPASSTHFEDMQGYLDNRDSDVKKHERPTNVIGASQQDNKLATNHLWKVWIEGDDQLRKRAAAALLEIFVINDNVTAAGLRTKTGFASSYMDMLEANAFGDFRTLLENVTLHPAMGEFLTYAGNTKAEYDDDNILIKVPDENYAREIMQLFTIGLHELNRDGTIKTEDGVALETYTQDDIVNLARVFTGWDLDLQNGRPREESSRLPMVLKEENHSTESKEFLGRVIPANTDGETSLRLALNTLSNHANVGPFIGKQLIQRLVTSNPSDGYVRRVATVFNRDENGVRGNMAAVFKAILLDDEARAADGQGPDFYDNGDFGKYREPMLRLVALARFLQIETDREIYPIGHTNDMSKGLGQSPLQSSLVFNFFRPGYVPTNSAISQNNLVAPEAQIMSGSSTIGYGYFLGQMLDGIDQGFAVYYEQMNELSSSPVDLVALLNSALTAGTMSQSSVDEIVATIEGIDVEDTRTRVRAALALVAMSPSFLIQK